MTRLVVAAVEVVEVEAQSDSISFTISASKLLQCIPRTKVLEMNEFELLQHKNIAGRPGDAPVSLASGSIVSMDSISQPGVAASAVGFKSLARHAPRVHLSTSSSTIPPSPAAGGLYPVSPLNNITGFQVPNDAFSKL